MMRPSFKSMMSISSIVAERTCRISLPGWVSELRIVNPGARVIDSGFGVTGAGGGVGLFQPSVKPTTMTSKPMTIRAPSVMTAASATR